MHVTCIIFIMDSNKQDHGSQITCPIDLLHCRIFFIDVLCGSSTSLFNPLIQTLLLYKTPVAQINSVAMETVLWKSFCSKEHIMT